MCEIMFFVISKHIIVIIIYFITLPHASVLDNVIEYKGDVIPEISLNGYYNIKEHTVEHIPSGDREQNNVGIDVFKDDILDVYWIKNGTYKVINISEEGYEKISENGTVIWKKDKAVVLQVSEDLYNYLLRGHVSSATETESKVWSHDGCSCLNNTICLCCMHITEVMHDQICIGLQILPNDLGVKGFLTVGDMTISQEISVKNPPSVCLIYIYKELEICMKVYDVDTSFKTLHGCLAVEFRAYRLQVLYVKLGCITAFDERPASIDHCAAHISSSTVVLTCLEKIGYEADFFILHVQQNSSIIEKKICSEPDFNITSLNAETVYDISIMPAVVKGNGSSFSFSLNTSRIDGEEFDRIFVNNMASSLIVQMPTTIFITYILYVITYCLFAL